jgi:hypothetical protein
VRLIHQEEHHHLDNQILGEGRQQEVHLHKEQQLGEPVQEAVVKYLHHAEVVVQHSGWQDMIPPSGYQNSKEKHQEDPEKHLFICENIWEEKQITDEDTKLAQLAITLRDHALDWYMSLAANSPPGTTRMIGDIKKLLINEFQKPSSEDQYMNEMIEIRQKPGESVWEIDQRFKRLKGKIKYVMTDMQHRHMFVNSLLPHLKYPLRQQKFQTQAEALQATLQLEENQYQKTDPSIEELKEDLKNLTFQLNQNKGKDKREVVWCTTCRTEGHHKNECPTFTVHGSRNAKSITNKRTMV